MRDVPGSAASKDAEPAGDSFANPVLKHQLDDSEKGIAGLRKATERIMGMTDAQVLANLPVQTPRIHNGCPNCRKGKRERHKHWDREQPHCFGKVKGHDKVYDPAKPDRYTCPDCGETYPGNPRFPADRTEALQNPAGEEIEVRYYLDPSGINYRDYGDSKPRARKYYLHGVLDTERHHWTSRRMYDLARLHHLTGDKEAARKALVILNAYADRFPRWLLTGDYGHRYVDCRGRRPPYGWVETREGRRSGDESNGPLYFMQTTDLLIGTPAMEEFSRELGEDLAEKLWTNLMKPITDRTLLSYPYRGLPEFGQTCPGGQYVERALVFRRPDLIHVPVVWGMLEGPSMVWGCDGGFIQGTGYGQIQLGAMSKMRELNGYSDPPGYRPPGGGTRIVHFRYPSGEYETFHMKAYSFLADLRMPDGGVPCYNDGEHVGYITWIPGSNTPIDRSRSVMKPGLKFAILGDGEGDRQVQAHLNFGENNVNHGHQDTLTLQLFAFGHYLIDDFEYTKNAARRYAARTSGHNTVVVDHRNQLAPFADGSPLLYEARLPGLAALTVDAARVYAPNVTKYSRTLILNTTELDRPYLIDIFQVAGGKVHDYFLRSSNQHAESAKVSLEMTRIPGDTPLLPPGEQVRGKDIGSGYRMFFDVSRARADRDFFLDYVVKKPWVPRKKLPHHKNRASLCPYKATPESWPDDPPVGTRHHFVASPGYEAHLFGSPDCFESIYRKRADADFHKWDRMPHFMMRHEATAGEESVFVVVHEPWVGEPKIRSVKRLPSSSKDLLALEIRYGDRTDTVLFSLSGEEVPAKVAGASFSGRLGLIAEKGGRTDGHLVGGTVLRKPSRGVDLRLDRDEVAGPVIRSYRKWNGDAFDGLAIPASALPQQDDLAGSFAILANRGAITDMVPENFPKLGARFYHRMIRDFEGLKGNLEKARASGRQDRIASAQEEMDEFRERARVLGATGGGWGFEVDRVERKGDELIVYTDGDHGLDIEGDRCAEYFFPQRHFVAPTTLTIYPAASTQRRVDVRPAGGAFMDAERITCRPRAPGNEVRYAIANAGVAAEPVWLEHGKPIPPKAPRPETEAAEPVWKEYRGPVTVDRNCTLLVKGVDPDGIKRQRHERYSFALPLPPAEVDPGALAPGLRRTIHSGLDDKGKVIHEDVHPRVDSGDFMDTYVVKRKMVGCEKFDGFIKIDAAGVYRIWFRPDQDGSLAIGGKVYVHERRQTATVMPYVLDVPLRAGFHRVAITHAVREPRLREGTPRLEFELSGPGGRRARVPASVFFHARPSGAD
ncbi:MAG: heparinase II/III domain-containing protein [Planctomycetota bacterium]